ncbi:MAG: metallophosphoesterase [Planctomycetes bacterium]|nr:metallophosphoesterase [Planctomycetota bacterium]
MISGVDYARDLIFFKNAVHALRTDKLRKGDLVLLPAQGDVFFTGDIHGNVENLERILQTADLEHNPQRHVVLHELIHNIYNEEFKGDYSYECLVLAAKFKTAFPDQVHIFAGNHELAELQGKEIMKNGIPIPLVFNSRRIGAMGGGAGALQATCRQFFRNLPVGLRTASGIWFSHSTPEKTLHKFSLEGLAGAKPATGSGTNKCSDPYLEEVVEDLVWGRDYNTSTARDFAQKVKSHVFIVGHEPCRGYSTPSPYHVILDSKDRFGSFCYLKLDKKYSQKGIVANIRSLRS